jgi:hypothetical protein
MEILNQNSSLHEIDDNWFIKCSVFLNSIKTQD